MISASFATLQTVVPAMWQMTTQLQLFCFARKQPYRVVCVGGCPRIVVLGVRIVCLYRQAEFFWFLACSQRSDIDIDRTHSLRKLLHIVFWNSVSGGVHPQRSHRELRTLLLGGIVVASGSRVLSGQVL